MRSDPPFVVSLLIPVLPAPQRTPSPMRRCVKGICTPYGRRANRPPPCSLLAT
ncbi:hypothetical protein TNCV_1305351, partial [Trichonephila clavipes]